MNEEDRVSEIRATLGAQGRNLLGPHQLEDHPDAGWFAPIVPRSATGGAAPYGWGRTRLEAAEDALNLWRQEAHH